jgi:hypothetical protein
MSLPYGKFPKKSARSPRGRAARDLRIRLNGRLDLEEFAYMLQRALARLQDQGVTSVEGCAIFLTPLTRGGSPASLVDANDNPLTSLELTLPAADRFAKASVRN